MAITFQVVRGQQRTHEFFQTIMDYGDIADRVKMPEDVLGDHLFDNDLTMQRQVNLARVKKELVPYLENDDAFFSALTLVMIPRTFDPLEEEEGYDFKSFDGKNSAIGELTVTSAVYLFPADGQHRAAAIKEVLKANPELALQQIPVVLVPFRSRPEVRQMFTDLNLNAKQPSRTIGLSFETRDPVALIAKAVEKRVELFSGRVNHFSNSLPASSLNVITMNSLHAGTKDLMAEIFALSGTPFPDSLAGKKLEHVEMVEAIDQAERGWRAILAGLPTWELVLSGSRKSGEIRDDYVLGFGVGWQAITLAASALVRTNPETWEERISEVLAKVDWTKKNPDWQGVCMIGSRVNNTAPAIRATAGYILEAGGLPDEENPFAPALAKSREAFAALEIEPDAT